MRVGLVFEPSFPRASHNVSSDRAIGVSAARPPEAARPFLRREQALLTTVGRPG
jgi:hypothetical protein